MTIRDRRKITVDGQSWVIQVTDDTSRTLLDPISGVAYHSGSGAVAETSHVYLKNSGIFDLLSRGGQASVLEIGFGTGLAMLMTVDVAISAGATLCYTAIERELVDIRLLEQLELEAQIGNASLVERFLQWRQRLGQPAGFGAFVWQADVDRQVTIEYQDARLWVWCSSVRDHYDAIYFDPFAPAVNPELWEADFLAGMHRMLKPSGNLVTYCVSRTVRQLMQSVGFNVQRVPGPVGGKREVLVATKS